MLNKLCYNRIMCLLPGLGSVWTVTPWFLIKDIHFMIVISKSSGLHSALCHYCQCCIDKWLICLFFLWKSRFFLYLYENFVHLAGMEGFWYDVCDTSWFIRCLHYSRQATGANLSINCCMSSFDFALLFSLLKKTIKYSQNSSFFLNCSQPEKL